MNRGRSKDNSGRCGQWGPTEISRNGNSRQQEQYPWGKGEIGGGPGGLVKPCSVIWGPSMHMCTLRKFICQYTNECAILSSMLYFTKKFFNILKSLWLLFQEWTKRSMSGCEGNTITHTKKILKGSSPLPLPESQS